MSLHGNFAYVDKTSSEYAKFKAHVDAQAARPGPPYTSGFKAVDAAVMYALDPQEKYARLAVRMVETYVLAAEQAIAAGSRPEIARDSYLYSGEEITDLAYTYRYCRSFMADGLPQRIESLAYQTIFNIWNKPLATWGGRPDTAWTGWGTNDPGNNYFYSFTQATMYWTFASGTPTFMDRTIQCMDMLDAYFANLTGGGSAEGTGYGTSHMRLFEIYRIWQDSGLLLSTGLKNHLRDTVKYWYHATVPGFTHFAPIGDQARSSMPTWFDYHTKLICEAMLVEQSMETSIVGGHLVKNADPNGMDHTWAYRDGLLPRNGNLPIPSLMSNYYASGAGHYFARTSWQPDAAWINVVCGKYNQSHAHQEQGSFNLWDGGWVAVTANIYSRSGIQQSTNCHNMMRFERAGQILRQYEGTECILTTTSTDNVLKCDMQLAPAYVRPGNPSHIQSWERSISLSKNNKSLLVDDTVVASLGVSVFFQMCTKALPVTVSEKEVRFGEHMMYILEGGSISVVRMRDTDADYTGDPWRIDVEIPSVNGIRSSQIWIGRITTFPPAPEDPKPQPPEIRYVLPGHKEKVIPPSEFSKDVNHK